MKKIITLIIVIIAVVVIAAFAVSAVANAAVYTSDINELYSGRPTAHDIAEQVLEGKWGVYPERMERIEAAGYDYGEVQDIVNELLKSRNKVSKPVYIERSATKPDNTEKDMDVKPEQQGDNVRRASKSDAEYIAKTIYGEAGFLPEDERAQVAWCILNRVDSDKYPDSISGVVTQYSQFHGYRESNPVTEENLAIAEDVIERWESGSDDRELGEDMLYFYGDGRHNYYRSEW